MKEKTDTKKPAEAVEGFGFKKPEDEGLEIREPVKVFPLKRSERENVYERKILRLCRKNKYPLIFKDGAVGHVVPDFINREKMCIVELYNPDRSEVDVQARMKAFHKYAFKFIRLTKHDLLREDWEEFCSRVIGSLLGD